MRSIFVAAPLSFAVLRCSTKRRLPCRSIPHFLAPFATPLRRAFHNHNHDQRTSIDRRRQAGISIHSKPLKCFDSCTRARAFSRSTQRCGQEDKNKRGSSSTGGIKAKRTRTEEEQREKMAENIRDVVIFTVFFFLGNWFLDNYLLTPLINEHDMHPNEQRGYDDIATEAFRPYHIMDRQRVSPTSFVMRLRPIMYTRHQRPEKSGDLYAKLWAQGRWAVELKGPLTETLMTYTPLRPSKEMRVEDLNVLVEWEDDETGSIPGTVAELRTGARVVLRSKSLGQVGEGEEGDARDVVSAEWTSGWDEEK